MSREYRRIVKNQPVVCFFLTISYIVKRSPCFALQAKTRANLFFYTIGNCTVALGHRSYFLYGAVCPNMCSPPAAFYTIGNCTVALGHRSYFLYGAVCTNMCSPPAAFYTIGNCTVALGHRSYFYMVLSARICAAHRLLFYI